jgi:hypothetical protein
MKKNLFLLIIAGVFLVSHSYAQDARLLRAADDSFEAGESQYNKKHYAEAAPSLEIVVENISINTDSRKYLLMRFEANVMLIDIYFKELNNLPSACRCLNSFFDDLSRVKDDGILKTKDLFRYLELEKSYEGYSRQCNNFESIDDKKTDFEKVFDEEFEDEE